MYKIIIISFLIILSNLTMAQDQRDFAFYNNETYALYMKADWEGLIPLAKESIGNGHDSYYIRMRLGIALYEQKKYTQAIPHFEKSLSYFPESEDAKAYLYYCYIFLGRRQEALTYGILKEDQPKVFHSTYFEPGIKLSDNKASTRDTRYIFIGLNHEFGNRVSFFHGYQRLASDFAYVLTIPGGPGQGGGGQWESIYTITQNEYYASFNVLLGKGFSLAPAYHFQAVRGDGYATNNNVFSIQMTKWAGKFKINGGYYNSEINELNQQQVEGGVAFYPMGNNKLYFQTQATYHMEDSDNNLVWFNKIGAKVFPKTWVDLSMSLGDMVNYSELNSLVVYNQLDIIKSRWGITMRQLLGKHMLYLNYVHENKEEYTTYIPFVHHNIIVGFNLTF